MKKHIMPIATIAAALTLASCGGSEKQDTAGGETKVSANQWNATDACALLDKAEIGAALKDSVTGTSLGIVNQASGPNAATSECTYSLAGGGQATLMTRWSPIADNTKETIAMTRKSMQATVAAFGKSVEDVPNLGKSAFFVPGINQMNVFIDDSKFVVLTLPSIANGDAKAVAADLVGKLKK